jgi:hypothetical protein
MNDDAALLASFLDGTIALDAFTHETHVRVTYLLLRDRPLPETMIALRDGLRRLAARAGHPEKYHETITFAFAALISERLARDSSASWSDFARANADLLGWRAGSVLDGLYDSRTLASEEARRSFLLPR